MEGSDTVCKRCMQGKDLVLIEHEVLPELVCSYCEKSDSELLCHGQPSCYACYCKTTSPKKGPVVQSMMAHQNTPPSSVLSYRTTRPGETKLSKKVEALLKDCRVNGLAAMRKTALLYYGLKDTPRVSWQTFLEKCEKKKHALLIFTNYQDKFVGGFLSEPLDANKPKITDQECGIFEQFKTAPVFWGVQGHRIRL